MNLLLEKYIDNSLSKAEEVELDLLLKSDPHILSEFEKYKAARVLSEAILEHEIIGNLDRLKSPKATANPYAKYIAILVGVLFVSFLVYTWTKSSEPTTQPVEKTTNKAQYAQLFVEPAWPVERGESDKLQSIMSTYLSGQTKEAIVQLEAEIGRYPDSLALQYWMAEIFTKESMYAKTEKYLSRLIDQKYPSDRLPYLEILYLIQSGKEADAQVKIEAIYKSSHPEYQEIYDKIKIIHKKGSQQ
jgi:DNA-binding XRE family transcriptional regulator